MDKFTTLRGVAAAMAMVIIESVLFLGLLLVLSPGHRSNALSALDVKTPAAIAAATCA